MPPRTAVFDLDGTLADTSGDLIAAANACFDAPLLDPNSDQATALRGGRAMLRLAQERRGHGDEADVDRLYPVLLEHYAKHIDRTTHLYDGVPEALEQLAEHGWILAICTNKPEGLAETLMARLGLRHRFQSLLGADSLEVRKPDPRHYTETVIQAGGSVPRSLLIGDTETDVKTAAAAGVPCIIVGFAPAGVPDGHKGPLIDRYADLPALLDEILPD